MEFAAGTKTERTCEVVLTELLDDRYCCTGNEKEHRNADYVGCTQQIEVSPRQTVGSRMRIFVVGTRGFPHVQGGIEAHCEHLYPLLAARGVDITVFTRSPYIARNARRSSWRGVKFVHVWAPRNKYLETVVHTFFCIIISRMKLADCLHIHAIGPALFAPLARILGLRVILTHHGPDYKRDKWGACAALVLRLGESLGLRCAHHTIVVSQAVTRMVKEKYPNKRITFIPNGVGQPIAVSGTSVLHKFHLAPQQYILAVGRFVPEKGLHDLIAAYRKDRAVLPKLVIVGGANHETAYSRSLRRSAQQVKGIVLTGTMKRRTLCELYVHCRLFVLPSHYEGLPITLLEAISYGAPVLVSDIEAHRELQLPSYRYFAVGNRERLARKMVELCSAHVERDELAAAKHRITETYDWNRIATMTRSLYSEYCSTYT